MHDSYIRRMHDSIFSKHPGWLGANGGFKGNVKRFAATVANKAKIKIISAGLTLKNIAVRPYTLSYSAGHSIGAGIRNRNLISRLKTNMRDAYVCACVCVCVCWCPPTCHCHRQC